MMSSLPVSVSDELLASGSAEKNAALENQHRLGFILFLLVTAVTFVRPAELLPSLEGLPIYLWVMVACILASFPVLLRQLSVASLRVRPETLAVVGLLPCIALSLLAHGRVADAMEAVSDAYKAIVYYLLLVGLVSSVVRLRWFLATLLLLTAIVAALSVLEQRGVLSLGTLGAVTDMWKQAEEGGSDAIVRIGGVGGMFGDPNDFSLILVCAIVISVSFADRVRGGVGKLAALAPLTLLGYAFMQTHSRGGFLALVAAAGVYAISRFGYRRSVPVLLVGIPVLLLAFAGRQTDIDLSSGTGQGRIQLWREGLVLMHHSPIFGIGYNTYGAWVGHVAHNSFVHAYVELGLLGGTLFLAAWYVPLRRLSGLRGDANSEASSSTAAWLPCILSIVGSQAVGLVTLSRCYVTPTYVVIGLAHVFVRLREREQPLERTKQTVSWMHVSAVGVLALVMIEVFVRTMAG
jgi:O-antigen ligase